MGSNAEAFFAGYQPKKTPINEQKRKEIRIASDVISIGQPIILSTVLDVITPVITPITPPITLNNIASKRNCSKTNFSIGKR